MTKKENQNVHLERHGVILVIAATVAWSLAGLFSRLIELDSWSQVFWRGIFGSLGIFTFIVCSQKKDKLNSAIKSFKKLDFPSLLYAVVSALGMVFFISAFQYTSVAHVSVIYATVPLVAGGLAWGILGEKITKSAATASIVAFAGICLMMESADTSSIHGDLLATGMTFCMAVMMLIARKYRNIPILEAACLSSLLSSLVTLPFSLPVLPNIEQFGLLFLFGIVNSALGLSLFIKGSTHLPAMTTALVTAMDAPLAPFWVWIFINEKISATTMLGGLVVFSAVFAQILPTWKRHKHPLKLYS